MNKFVKAFSMVVVVFFSSCQEEGTTTQYLSGNEDKLPPELKGLKIYSVSTGASFVKVAIFDNQVNSLTYREGKHDEESTIILNKQTGQLIEVSQVIMENDSLIICRK